MKCRYKFCPNEVPIVASGHQPLYCRPAHKQAEYRRRNPDTDRRKLKKQLAEARARIYLLERFIREHAPAGYRAVQNIAPTRLGKMLDLHNVGGVPLEVVLQNGILKPVNGELDAEQQETFYTIFHKLPGWRSCPDCPHGIIP